MQALTSFMMITNTIYVILVPLLVITILVLGIMALIRYNRTFVANQKKDEKLKKSLGEILKDYRLKAGLSQEYVAHELGVSRQAISKWENGKGLPDVSLMLPLCEVLEINVNELLCAKHLKDEEKEKKAEENIIGALDENDKKKRRLRWLSAFLILIVTILGSCFMIDVYHMKNNEEVIFSKWSFDYTPGYDPLNDRVKSAIESFFEDESMEFVSVYIFDLKEDDIGYTAYIEALSESYILENDKAMLDESVVRPYRIKLSKDLAIKKSESPLDFSYNEDLDRLFPKNIKEAIFDFEGSGFIEKLKIENEAKANLYFKKIRA